MPDDFELKIDTSQFDALLAKLPAKVSGAIMKNALQTAGDVLLASMKALAPEQTNEPTPGSNALPPGILREDLHTQVIVSETKGAQVKVGPTEIAGHVARWVNNGWMLTSRDGQQIKQIPGKHFMEAAADEAAELAIDAFATSLAVGLEDENEETN
jgi:hypothetical protein